MIDASKRRRFLQDSSALVGAAAGGFWPGPIFAQSAKIKLGLMLPFTGTYAQLGVAIENGFRLALQEKGNRIAGREFEYFRVDDESEPVKATENTSKLVQRDKVDVLIGTVHTGVLMGMLKLTREAGLLHIIPNAGAAAATGALCAANVFRSSFTNWQTTYPLGQHLMNKGHRNAIFLTWRYGAGEEAAQGFREGYVKAGGTLVREFFLNFPNVEFHALLAEIGSLKPDTVACFYAGGGAIKFLKDYAAAGLRGKIPLYGSGFLTEGVLDAVGDIAEGIETVLHYGDGLSGKRNAAFRLAYAKTFKQQPDVYAVQGYDAGQLLIAGLEAVKGDFGHKAGMIKAMEAARIDSPRGPWVLSKAHNPVQDIYLRRVVGKENKVIGVAHKALADPATGCRLS